MSDTCIFCRIASGEIPSPKIAESANAFAIHDVAPAAPTHVLVISREHIPSMAHTENSALLGEMLSLAAKVARDAGIADSGYRTVVNIGDNGGQSVPHLHMHVLGGRHMGWPPG